MDSHESLVDLIFAKCSLVYGREFIARWEGFNLAEVKADWARELGPLLDSPQSIKHALEHLPERPPNVLQFRALCINRPQAVVKALPAPATDRARVRDLLARARRAITGG